MICLQTGRPDQAERLLRQLIGTFPAQAIYCERLVTLLERRGKQAEAIASYRELLQRNPGFTSSRYNLARLYKRVGQADKALLEYDECLRRGIDRPEEVHTNISVIHSDLQHHDAARQSLLAALASNPAHVPALFNLAQLEEECGDGTSARELFSRILHLDPMHAGALAHLANAEKVSTAVDPLIRSMKRALRRHDAKALAREELLYALGKTHDDCGQYATAMDYYRQANTLSRKRCKPYHPPAQEKLVDNVIAACDAGWLGAVEPVSGDAHIFICGMFRSGSTLVEQILAAHPAVTAGGEIDYFQRETNPFPASVQAMSPAQLRSLGEGYNALLAQAFPGAKRVTNKRPDNFLYLGLIKSLFPNALIINTLRQPLDNCLSLFFQPLDTRLDYANDLRHAGHYYLQYRRVMAHWQQFLGGNMLAVDYEALVDEPQQTIAGVLSFLQLDWHDDCLHFHRLRNRVRTASLHQVRQPLYQGSVGRWRNYAGAFEALQRDLQHAGVSCK